MRKPRIYTAEQREARARRSAEFFKRLKSDPVKYRQYLDKCKLESQDPVRKARKLELERKRMADPKYRAKINRRKAEQKKIKRATDPEWRERDNIQQMQRWKKNCENIEWKEKKNFKHREYCKRKKEERQRLLDAMTKGQRVRFLGNEKKIRLEKKRNKIANAALAKQIHSLNQIKAIKEGKRTERERLEMEAKQLQIDGLNHQKQIFENSRIDLVIAKLQSMRQSRLDRYRQWMKSPRDRYLWAIDYYYQLIEENNAQAESNLYFKNESIMKLSKVA